MGLKLDRRRFLAAAGASVSAASFSVVRAMLAHLPANETQTVKPELANVKACVFDTFGTVVDWRSSVIAEAANWGKAKGLNVNWVEFTDRWRTMILHGIIPHSNSLLAMGAAILLMKALRISGSLCSIATARCSSGDFVLPCC